MTIAMPNSAFALNDDAWAIAPGFVPDGYRFSVLPAPSSGGRSTFDVLPVLQSGNGDFAVTAFDTASTEPAPTDDYFDIQWHFAWLGDIQKIWEDYTGDQVHVGVFDDGVLTTHEDLEANYDWSLAVIGPDGVTPLDPNPTYDGSGYSGAKHGTAVSGLIAAARNDIGTVGVAYNAGLTVVDILSGNGPADINQHFYEFFAAAQTLNFDVVNHSWGNSAYFYQATDYPDGVEISILTTAAFEYTRDFGRVETFEDGTLAALGTIQVKAAGNQGQNANGVSGQSSRAVVVVGAYDDGGSVSYYSNFGANLLVSAPSSGSPGHAGQVTTDLPIMDGNDYGYGGLPDASYTSGFGGTSGAAPIVSGVVALMLDANEFLGWRDVQNILAYSAREIGSGVGNDKINYEYFDWQYNGADNWNGGGLHFSNDYGYGSVDAYNAVRMAEVWSLFGAPKASDNESSYIQSTTEAIALEDGMTTDITFTFGGDPFAVDFVDITLTMSHSALSDLDIVLISPNGTEISIIDFSTQYYDDEKAYWTWTFGVNTFRGEEGTGEWTLRFTDDWIIDAGTLDSASIALHGTDGAADALTSDVYHYTSEVFTSIARESGRLTLTDSDGGSDWINAAALASNLVIRLASGATSTAGGQAFVQIANGTDIENAVAGDGNDEIYGNDLGNALYGMRGNDTIVGGAGNDTLSGGVGNDTLTGGAGADNFLFDRALGTANVDIVIDFSQVDDSIWLDSSIFTSLAVLVAGGLWVSSVFYSDVDINGVDAYLLYDFDAGELYYDADGSAATANSILFATFAGGSVDLSFEDFTIVSSLPDAPQYVNDRSEPQNPITVSRELTEGLKDYDTELIVGTQSADQILIKQTDTLNHKIFGLGGQDVIVGGAGNDYIDGGANNDVIWGGAGDDILIAGGGDVNTSGGPLLEAAGEEMYGGTGNDFIQGSNQTNDWTFKNSGLYGDDQINGGLGDDIIYALDGDDSILGDDYINPETGMNETRGGNDVLYGGGGSDWIMGGAGDDRIYAGTGYLNEVYGDINAGVLNFVAGTDTLVFEGNFADYDFSSYTLNAQFLIASRTTPGDVENTMFFDDFEYLEFNDRTIDIKSHALIYTFNAPWQGEPTREFPDIDLVFEGYEVAAIIRNADSISLVDRGAETGDVDRLQTVSIQGATGDILISSSALEFLHLTHLDGSVTVDRGGSNNGVLEIDLGWLTLDDGQVISDDTANEIIFRTNGSATRGVFANGADTSGTDADGYNLSFAAAESIRWKFNYGDVFVKWNIPNVTTIDMTYNWPDVLGQDDNTGIGNNGNITIETALDDESLATAGGSIGYNFIGGGTTFIRFGNRGDVYAGNDGTLGEDAGMNAGLGLAGHVKVGGGSVVRILGSDAFKDATGDGIVDGTVDGSGTAAIRMTFAVGEAIGDISANIENFKIVHFDVTSRNGNVDVRNFDNLTTVAIGGYAAIAGENSVTLLDNSTVVFHSVGDATNFGTVNLFGSASGLDLWFEGLWNDSFPYVGIGDFDISAVPPAQVAEGIVHVADAVTVNITTNSRDDIHQLDNGVRAVLPAVDSFAQALDLDVATKVTLRGDTGWDFTVAGTDISHVTTIDASGVTRTGSLGAVKAFAQTSDAVNFTGGRGDDTFAGLGGNDTFNGGAGFDTVKLSGIRSNYTISTAADGALVITDLRGGTSDGEDTLRNIERIEFSDGSSIGTGTDLTGAPADIVASTDRVVENSENGSIVATLFAIDPDSADTNFTYSILYGNRAFAIEGDKLVVGDTLAFDHEGSGMIFDDYGVYRTKVWIRATDSSGKFVDKELTFWVTDLVGEHVVGNDFRNVIWGGAGDDYFEGGGGDDYLDARAGNNTLYGGAGNDDIRGDSGGESTAIYSGNRTEYKVEKAPSGFFERYGGINIIDSIESRDGADYLQGIKWIKFADGTFLATDLLANSAPTGILPDVASVAENSADGTVVAELTAEDPDSGDTFAYTLTDDAGGRFSIVDGKLVVADSTGLDYEAASIHVVTVKVTDSAGNSLEEDIVVNVTDVDENAAASVSLENLRASIAENASTAARIKVADIVVADDGIGTNQLSLVGRDRAMFEIIGMALFLKAGMSLDARTMSTLDVAVAVDDVEIDGSPDATSATYKLKVADVAGLTMINGTAASQTLSGTSGNDWFDGHGGTDTFKGGRGNDTYVVDSKDKVVEGSGQGTDKVLASVSHTLATNVENLTLTGTANISGTGNSSNNVLIGNAGHNKLAGGSGNDKLYGGAGNDSLDGGNGNDRLYGQDGHDTLKGGSGNDRLDGGLGRDYLYGGSGRDVFDFNSIAETAVGSARDVIYDFRRGQDDIDLSSIDANVKAGGNQAFSWIGTSGFSGKAGQLHMIDQGSQVIVQGDVDGDRKADFDILVKVGTLSAGDFIL
jgi:Ca2+-binding RTX toxin-like protein